MSKTKAKPAETNGHSATDPELSAGERVAALEHDLADLEPRIDQREDELDQLRAAATEADREVRRAKVLVELGEAPSDNVTKAEQRASEAHEQVRVVDEARSLLEERYKLLERRWFEARRQLTEKRQREVHEEIRAETAKVGTAALQLHHRLVRMRQLQETCSHEGLGVPHGSVMSPVINNAFEANLGYKQPGALTDMLREMIQAGYTVDRDNGEVRR